MSKKKTTEQFIEEARKVHVDKFDYSETIYNGKEEKVKIICRKHGIFEQKAANHIRLKQGCPYCKYEKLSLEQRSNKEDFIKKAKLVHGAKYDYSKVKYVNSRTNVVIRCLIHGDFKQTPHAHICGKHGCPVCANNNRIGTEKFIEEAKKIHGSRYDYSKVEYVNANSKVRIICPKHGEFLQTPFSHLKGHGCLHCNQSKLEKEIASWLDFNNIQYERQKKFEWLKYKLPLSLDFYLPKYNVAIECQGIQHFEEHKIFESLEKIQERDKVKNELCKENGIDILYFSITKYSNNYFLGNIYCNKNDLLKRILEYDNN